MGRRVCVTVAQSRGGRGVRIKPRKGGISGYMNDVHSTIAITESIARAGEGHVHSIKWALLPNTAQLARQNDGHSSC